MKSIAWALVFFALIVDAAWGTMNGHVHDDSEKALGGFFMLVSLLMVLATTIWSN